MPGAMSAASRRVEAIFNAALVLSLDGRPFATHVPSLKVLGSGRCAGIRVRPLRMCPTSMQGFLCQVAIEAERGKQFKREFPLEVPRLRPPVRRVTNQTRRQAVCSRMFGLVQA